MIEALIFIAFAAVLFSLKKPAPQSINRRPDLKSFEFDPADIDPDLDPELIAEWHTQPVDINTQTGRVTVYYNDMEQLKNLFKLVAMYATNSKDKDGLAI